MDAGSSQAHAVTNSQEGQIDGEEAGLPVEQTKAEESQEVAREEEAALNEDPEAQRRSKIDDDPGLREIWPSFEFYGSLRVHAINHFDEDNSQTEVRFGDGGSRIGARGEYQLTNKWWLFGRAEAGFDVLENYSAKSADVLNDSTIQKRLLYGGFDSESLTLTFGKNWSTYYKVAGVTDRFSIFGGEGVGVNNARTDGGSTGTGRADDTLQARIYMDSINFLDIKPFNLNVQYQNNEPIPHVQGRNYGKAYSASTWLESQKDRGFGVAYHRAELDDPDDPLIKQAGIDGDAEVLAMAFRMYGEDWYGALVVARLENIETNDQLKYISGRGVELYVQWQFRDRWWVIAGGNWLKPFDDDPEAGEYEVAYGVLGLRYTFDSFQRMLYFEYRFDDGTLTDGRKRGDELTFGVRWDFGY